MLSAFFNSSTAYGWILSIGGALFILLLCWQAIIQLRAAAPKSPDEPLLAKLDELHAAILAGEVKEAPFVAWIERVQLKRSRDRIPTETSALVTSRSGIQEAMRHQNWERGNITTLINRFWSITVEDLDVILPAKR